MTLGLGQQLFIYQEAMQGEDLQAGNNLRNLSQRTSYIMDWGIAQKTSSKHPQSIPEEPHTNSSYPKPKQLQKETSEKYDLRKCQQKLQALKDPPSSLPSVSISRRVSLPHLQQGVFESRQALIPSIYKRKHSKSLAWMRPVEQEYLRNRVQAFQRKNTDSQKDLQNRLAAQKHKYLPLHVNAKLNQQEMKQKRIAVREQQIEVIRKIIASRLRGDSVRQMRMEDYVLPTIRAMH